MKAVLVRAFGPPERLEVCQVPEPAPKPSQVLVAVEAAAVNYSDVLQRQGRYLGGPKPPFVAGSEAAGTVLQAPPNSSLSKGQRVMLLAPSGAHAERITVDAQRCVPVPAGLASVDAAAFQVPFLTAYHCLHTVARCQPEEVVVIHAAGGGLGEAVVQVARALALRVVAVASNEAKRAHARKLGAQIACDYGNVRAAVADMTAGRGANIVLDGVGGQAFNAALRVLAPFGRAVLVGASSGQVQRVDATRLVFRSQGVLGFHLAQMLERPDALRDAMNTLLTWLDERRIRARASHRLPLDEAARAHRLLEDRDRIGRVVLTP